MDEFNYLSVLLSIILGLAVTQVLKGLRGLILARGTVSFYWPSLAWAIFLLLICVQSWWAMFGMRQVKTWTFLTFFVVLLQTIITYLVAALVFPDFGAQRVDLREHYFGHRRWFSGLLMAVIVVSLFKEYALTGLLPNGANLAFHAIFIVLSGVALLTRREAVHKLLPLLCLGLFIAYIVFLFATLH